MPKPFEDLREALLLAGVAPRHVRAFLTELTEHLSDLTERECATGCSAQEAFARARAALGDDKTLAEAMLARSGMRSLAARAPWAVFGILPVMAIIALSAGTAMSMMHGILAAGYGAVPKLSQAMFVMASLFASYLIGPLVSITCLVVGLRQRTSPRWVWTALGLVAISSAIFGGLHGGGEHPYFVLPLVIIDGRVNTPATLGLAALRASVFFVLAAFVWRSLKNRHATTE